MTARRTEDRLFAAWFIFCAARRRTRRASARHRDGGEHYAGQHRLAHLLNGEAHPSGAITFGGNTLTVSIGGVVRVNGVQVGMWGDGVEALAVAAMEVAA